MPKSIQLSFFLVILGLNFGCTSKKPPTFYPKFVAQSPINLKNPLSPSCLPLSPRFERSSITWFKSGCSWKITPANEVGFVIRKTSFDLIASSIHGFTQTTSPIPITGSIINTLSVFFIGVPNSLFPVLSIDFILLFE